MAVANGLFTVLLDYGVAAWDSAGRWVETAVRCPSGSGSFTTLAPRQAITGLSAGTYGVGLCGYSADFANWNSNDYSYTSAIVIN